MGVSCWVVLVWKALHGLAEPLLLAEDGARRKVYKRY